MLVLVVTQRGLERLVEEREVDLGEVDDVVTQRALLVEGLLGPSRDARADARGPGAADDQGDPVGGGGGSGFLVHFIPSLSGAG